MSEVPLYPRAGCLRNLFEGRCVVWCFGALYYTHIVALDTPNFYGVIKVSYD